MLVEAARHLGLAAVVAAEVAATVIDYQEKKQKHNSEEEKNHFCPFYYFCLHQINVKTLHSALCC